LKDGRRQGRKPFLKAGGYVGESTAISSVMFVPSMKGGILLKKLKEKEQELSKLTGFKIKYVEMGGAKLGNSFSTNLCKGMHCQKVSGGPCNINGEKREDCRSRNITYESVCRICNKEDMKEEKEKERSKPSQEEGRKRVYIAETSRSLFERSSEHYKDAENIKRSHIWSNTG
jgi:hypothetical protein